MWKGMRCIWPDRQTPPHRAEQQRDKIQLVASEREGKSLMDLHNLPYVAAGLPC